MYNETMYLNFNDLNKIENKIEQLTNLIKQYNPSTPTFNKKTWQLNEFPYIQEIQRIETGVDNLGMYYYKPEEWEETRIWLEEGYIGQVIKSFSFTDINRWIKNMNLIENIIGDEETIWNGQTYIDWEIPSNKEWSDN